MNNRLRILHLEDDANDVELVQRALKKAGLLPAFKTVCDRDEFQAAVETGDFDVILSDTNVAGFDGGLALRLARERRPGIPFVFVSGFASAAQARERQSLSGATDCVSKSELRSLAEIILKAVRGRQADATQGRSDWYVRGLERLVSALQELSLARDLDRIMAIVRHAAREVTGADGATFVLREGDYCHYVDEEAIEPLWKGRRFPMTICVSGWTMLNRAPAVIEDIYEDSRIAADVYRPTFVKSLVMVPIRTTDPVGAIGTYWAARRQPSPEEVKLLQALADSASIAMENVQLYADLGRKAADRTARLAAVNEELEAFSYSVSHDLRAPLRHINGYLEILQEEAGNNLNVESQRSMRGIADATGRMGTLIDDLLGFSRLGRVALRPGRVDTNELIEEVRREMISETKDRTIEWAVDKLPEVHGDRALLKLVWVNLLSNAVKYSRHRAPAEIRVGAVVRDGETEFVVQDNGAGFDMQYADKLFGVFQRLHRRDEFEGAGIGLANVRRIIDRHGGRTWARAEVNRGAALYFTLPTPGRT